MTRKEQLLWNKSPYLQYSVNVGQVVKHNLEGWAGKVATQHLPGHQDQRCVHPHDAKEKT